MDLLLVSRIARPDDGRQLWGPDNRQLQAYEVRGLVAIYWPAEELARAAAIAHCESGDWTGAWAYSGEDSRGLFQLNVEAHPEYRSFNLFDPQINCYFAFELWSSQGWGPWTCAHKLGFV